MSQPVPGGTARSSATEHPRLPRDRVALSIAVAATLLGGWLGLVAPGVSPVTAPAPSVPATAPVTPVVPADPGGLP